MIGINPQQTVCQTMQNCIGDLYTCIYESPYDEWKENTGNYTVYIKVAVTKLIVFINDYKMSQVLLNPANTFTLKHANVSKHIDI